ncbi:MAG: hypothetical protein JRF64_04950 [Deltaproteobacteria bacterium]|jgi:hypothetical protein|nr:hypothetical protein [Deltaproteobacteria bacterium]MBW2565576.1 hypothetical protein [Deltaproteobacteria bacterium]
MKPGLPVFRLEIALIAAAISLIDFFRVIGDAFDGSESYLELYNALLEIVIQKRAYTFRGRNAGYPAPPAQIPACGTTALGSLTRKRCWLIVAWQPLLPLLKRIDDLLAHADIQEADVILLRSLLTE